MPIPALPRGLKPALSGYSFDGPSGVVSTEVAGGLPRIGLAYARGPQMFKAVLILRGMAMQVWTAFYHDTLANGSLAFSMPLDSGNGLMTHTATMLPGSYSAQPMGGGLWSVGFSIIAEPSTYTLGAAFGATITMLYDLYGEDAADMIVAITRLAIIDSLALALP